jgi:hypothetical protein
VGTEIDSIFLSSRVLKRQRRDTIRRVPALKADAVDFAGSGADLAEAAIDP